jgi:hypothetical protein
MDTVGSQCDDQINAIVQQDSSLMVLDKGKEGVRECKQIMGPKIFFTYLNHTNPGFHCLGEDGRQGTVKGVMPVGQEIETGKRMESHARSCLEHALDRAAGGGV